MGDVLSLIAVIACSIALGADLIAHKYTWAAIMAALVYLNSVVVIQAML